MSEGTTPERVTIAYTKDDVEQMQVDALRFYQQTVVPDLRAQLDAANKRIAEREQDLRDTTKQVEYERIQHATQLAERDARIAELEADLDAISKAFRLHTRPPTTGT